MTWPLLRASFYRARVRVSEGVADTKREGTGSWGASGARGSEQVQLEQLIPEGPLHRLQPHSFTLSGSSLVCVCFAVSLCVAPLQSLCFLFCGVCFHQITSTRTVPPALPLVSGRKKHLDVEMDWFVALSTGIRNITGFSESVKYLWECLLTVCYYIRKSKSCCYFTEKVDNFPPKRLCLLRF